MGEIFRKKKTESEHQGSKDYSKEGRIESFIRFWSSRSKAWRAAIMSLVVAVVFITTYGLILPAITIEKDAAKKMPGIHLESDSSHDEERRTSGDKASDKKKGESDEDEAESGDEAEDQKENTTEESGTGTSEDTRYLTEPLACHVVNYDVTLSMDEKAHIPEGTSLVMKMVSRSSQNYKTWEESLTKRNANLKPEAFFEIKLVKDGKEIRPDQPVDLTFTRTKEADHGVDYGVYFRDGKNGLKAHLITPEYTLKDNSKSDSRLKAGTRILMKKVALNKKHNLSVIGLSRLDEESKGEVSEKSGEGKGLVPDVKPLTYPAKTFRAKTGKLDISVEAPEGALPKGTTMRVREVSAKKTINSITETVEESNEESASKDNSGSSQDKKDKNKKEADSKKKEVKKVYAVDITFTDKEGNEIEPVNPVRVTMSSKIVRDAAADKDKEIAAVHYDDAGEGSLMDIETDKDAVSFDAESFSVYALVEYTVDFEYSVNSKMYQFSLPGGGFVSFTDLVEVLGIIGDTYNEENRDENTDEIEEQITDGMLDVTASDAAKKFVADVESVEFSSPELVWVGKVDTETTVGALKEVNGLKCQYSAELTEDQIETINSTEVESGDWALISVQPFASEETLTVTMKTGEVFTIRVTDAQIKKTVISASGETYEITVTYDDSAQIPNGAELKVKEILPEDEKYDQYYQESMEKVGVVDTMAEEEHESIADVVTDALGGLKDLVTGDDTDEKEKDEQTADPTSNYARIFDVQIWADDHEVQPKSAVTVNIKLFDAPEDEYVVPSVVHFAKAGAELMELSEKAESSEDNGLQFVTDEFSVYSVVYTVDFFYNGYAFSIKGGEAISLKELAEKLHLVETMSIEEGMASGSDDNEYVIPDDESIKPQFKDSEEFIKNVEIAEFSNPELIWVGKVEEKEHAWELCERNELNPVYPDGITDKEYCDIAMKEFEKDDWAIISLKPFTSEETLTITMINGTKYIINVTDDADAVLIDDGNGGQIVQTISNPSGTTIDLFDYWISDNLRYSSGMNGWPGHTGDAFNNWQFDTYNYSGQYIDNNSNNHMYQDSNNQWAMENGYLRGNGNNSGINSGKVFKFYPGAAGSVQDPSQVGNRNNQYWSNNHDKSSGNDGKGNAINSWTGDADPTTGLVEGRLVNDYPKLTSNASLGSDGSSLAYLFDTTTQSGKQRYGGVNDLLYVDSDGYYTYDSRYYSATFDGTASFTLREHASGASDAEKGFWPFGDRVYWHGMHMTTNFSMPANGQVLNPNGEYKDMQFEFSGDDDTWLYIDGVLVGDGGGIHNRTEIDINFKTGVVTVTGVNDTGDRKGTYTSTTTLRAIFENAEQKGWVESGYVAKNFDLGSNTFKSGTYHTFEMFYLERGGSESNLYIHYNLISTTDFSAHKSYHSEDSSRLLRDQFQFELIGFDNTEYTNGFVQAIMPANGASDGAGTVASPKKTHSNTAPVGIDLPTGLTAHTSLIIGVSEDGNVNFGNVQVDASQNGKEYKYIVREVVPDSAVNADGIRWDEASDEVKAEGGFVENGITYDGKVYYFIGKVEEVLDENDQPTGAYELKKYRYTDATYTERDTVTKFFSFVNGYVKPITLKVLKKSDSSDKLLSGAEFTLTRAMQNESDQWVVRQYQHNGETVPSTPRTGTTSAGVLTFDNLTEGHYILEETAAPAGYEKNSTYRWLLTLTKQDAADKIILVPTIQALDADGNLIGTATELTPDANNVIEHEVLNGKIPVGDITVEKKWLKVDGTSVYTDDELEALGVDGTKITGELWRKRDGVTNPTVTIVAYQQGNNASTLTKTINVAYGGSLSYVLSINKTTSQYVTSTSTNVQSVSVTPRAYSLIHVGQSDVTVTNKNGVSWIRNSANVYRLSNITEDITVTVVYTSSTTLGSNGIGYGTVSVDAPQAGSNAPVDEKFADFTLQKGAWSRTWTATELYGSDQDEDWTYYFKNVTESPEPVDFVFTDTPEVNVVGTKTTYTYKNIYQKVSIKIVKVIKDTETPLAGAEFTLTQVDSDKHVMKDEHDQPIIQVKTSAETTGELTFEGLVPGGWYMIEETGMPAGYVKKEGPYYIHINDDGSGTLDTTVTHDLISPESGNEFIIENEPGVALPNTGGPGTRLFTILGSILILGAGVLLWRRRRLI